MVNSVHARPNRSAPAAPRRRVHCCDIACTVGAYLTTATRVEIFLTESSGAEFGSRGHEEPAERSREAGRPVRCWVHQPAPGCSAKHRRPAR